MLGELGDEIQRLRKEFENFVSEKIRADFGAIHPYIFEPLYSSVLSGGKRVRPIITSLISFMLGIPKKKAFTIAYSIELSHAFTLIHDDIIDKPKERRGEPPLFQRFGQELSLLIGDMLMTYSFIPISSCPQAVNFFASYMCSVIEGQILDVMWSQKKLNLSDNVDNVVLQIQTKKTASLFKISCVLPLYFSDPEKLGGKGAMRKIEHSLNSLALHFGISFQILDDIYDVKEDEISGAPNILSALGKEKTLSLLEKEIWLVNHYLEKFFGNIRQISLYKYERNSKLLKFFINEILNYEKALQALS